VADVDIRDVNRMIDEDILPKELVKVHDGRWVQANACAFVSFYVSAAEKLTKEERLNVIAACKRVKPNRYFSASYRASFLTVNLEPFAEKAETRHRKLDEARTAIETDEDVLSGTPVFKGTRVPVRDVAASVKKGLPMERILRGYPELDERMLELAVIYADANPARGRPKGSSRS
jgi:uncharacterized protein (DUF433 family)